MRRNFEQPILDLDDQPIIPTGGDKPLMLTTVALNSLLATFDDERALTGKEKADRLALALKIRKRPSEVDITAEQLAMVKHLIGKACTTLIVGRAYELLELEPRAVAEANSCSRHSRSQADCWARRVRRRERRATSCKGSCRTRRARCTSMAAPPSRRTTTGSRRPRTARCASKSASPRGTSTASASLRRGESRVARARL